ncbi:MAG: Gfo/Idh/MocA family oxidoreductase [Ignisphaera sp.]
MKKFNVGVIGLGMIGETHVKAFAELKREGYVDTIGILTSSSSKAEHYRSIYGCKVYTSLSEIARDNTIDVVSIATPHYLHHGQAMLFMEYGKHVIVEKPMAVSVTAAKEMISKAKKKGVKLGVIFQHRYADDVKQLKRYLDNGLLGDIHYIQAEVMWWREELTYYLRDEVARSWRGMWSTEGGGVMINQAIHTVDLVQWFSCSVAEEVYGYIDNLMHPSINVEDIGIALIKFKNKVYASMVASLCTRPPSYQYTKIKIFGSKGFAELYNDELRVLKSDVGIDIDKTLTPIPETLKIQHELHTRLFKDFLIALREDRDFPINGEEGLKSLEIVRALYISSTTKQPIKLPLHNQIIA